MGLEDSKYGKKEAELAAYAEKPFQDAIHDPKLGITSTERAVLESVADRAGTVAVTEESEKQVEPSIEAQPFPETKPTLEQSHREIREVIRELKEELQQLRSEDPETSAALRVDSILNDKKVLDIWSNPDRELDRPLTLGTIEGGFSVNIFHELFSIMFFIETYRLNTSDINSKSSQLCSSILASLQSFRTALEKQGIEVDIPKGLVPMDSENDYLIEYDAWREMREYGPIRKQVRPLIDGPKVIVAIRSVRFYTPGPDEAKKNNWHTEVIVVAPADWRD